MKNFSKKILIPIGILLLICLLAIIGYKGYSSSKAISEFSTYVDEYKQVITTYILTDNQERYDELIKESEQSILDRNPKKIEELKLKLNQFKEELLKTNTELARKNISELESIDISKLSDKESILSKIEDIKKLINEQKFISANDEFIALKNDIDSKLEIIRQEELKALEVEKKKAEEEAKRIAEEKRKADELSKEMTKEEAIDLVNKNKSSFNSIGLACEDASQYEYYANRDKYWRLPKEEYYHVYLSGPNAVVGFHWLVGKTSKNVYSMGNQGCSPAFLIKDGVNIKTYEYIGPQ
ncbi:MAG: hypothetical protein ACRDA5_04910 [Clostridium sp.]